MCAFQRFHSSPEGHDTHPTVVQDAAGSCTTHTTVPMSSGKSSKKGFLPCCFLKSLIQALRSPKLTSSVGMQRQSFGHRLWQIAVMCSRCPRAALLLGQRQVLQQLHNGRRPATAAGRGKVLRPEGYCWQRNQGDRMPCTPRRCLCNDC